jgi:hypothetical protein
MNTLLCALYLIGMLVISGVVAMATALIINFTVAPVATIVKRNYNPIAEKRNKKRKYQMENVLLMLAVLSIFMIKKLSQVIAIKFVMIITVLKAIIKRDIASVLSINEDMSRLTSILNAHMDDIWLTLYYVIGEDLIINSLIFNQVDCIYSGYISNQKGCDMYIKVYGGSGLRMLSLAVFNAHGRVARPPPVVTPLRRNYSIAEK